MINEEACVFFVFGRQKEKSWHGSWGNRHHAAKGLGYELPRHIQALGGYGLWILSMK